MCNHDAEKRKTASYLAPAYCNNPAAAQLSLHNKINNNNNNINTTTAVVLLLLFLLSFKKKIKNIHFNIFFFFN